MCSHHIHIIQTLDAAGFVQTICKHTRNKVGPGREGWNLYCDADEEAAQRRKRRDEITTITNNPQCRSARKEFSNFLR